MNTDIDFRWCDRVDYPACAGIGEAAFASDAYALAQKIKGIQLHRIYTAAAEVCDAVSTYSELAIVDGEVAGFIFGRIERHFTLMDKCRSVKRYLPLLGRFLLGEFGPRRKLLQLLGPLAGEEQVLRRNVPPSEGRIEYFAVSPEYQGKGVGTRLMDRFVQYAGRYGVRAVSVFTGETVSFWFYERYGFQRWAEFDSPLGSYLHGKPIKGFSYRLPLQEKHIRVPN
ncbi:GNAT family N-acetyltransferase [Dehalococcoidia bacterium]|nr:GNAT family N-acetyltransferase [Dehalococcoidia bacterium]